MSAHAPMTSEGAGPMAISRILVAIDFSPASDAALEHALAVADATGADIEVLYVWQPEAPGGSTIFAETPEGLALEQRLSAAESAHPARVSGRLEFGVDACSVILGILHRERFDLCVLGRDGAGRHASLLGHVAATVAQQAPCKVVLQPARDATVAA